MNLLALDTSGTQTGVAALRRDRRGIVHTVAARALPSSRQLSRLLLATIDATLQAAEWTLDDVDALAVGRGPGSWTGLRIGLTATKTLAQVRGLPLCGVPTFDGAAQAVWQATGENADADDAPEPSLLLIGAPCRPGELYGKLFVSHPDYLAKVQPEWIGPPAQWADTAAVEALALGLDAPLLLAGEAAPALATLLTERGEAHRICPLTVEDLAAAIGLAAFDMLDANLADDPLTLQPLYLAPSAAERNLLAGKLKTGAGA